MDGYCSTGQSPQQAVVPVEEEEEEEKCLNVTRSFRIFQRWSTKIMG
jgi:hypothetical protein